MRGKQIKQQQQQTQIPGERHATKDLASILQLGKVTKNKVNLRSGQNRVT